MGRHRRNANQKYHDRVAGRYEQIYDDPWWLWHDALTWEYLKPHLPTNLRAPVIDLGCGSGKWGRKLLKSGYSVTFLDLSAGMVDEARKQVEQAGGSERAAFVQADLMNLSALPADHFALATAMGEPLCSTDEPSKAVRQIARILAPGGVLVATVDNKIACIDHYIENADIDALEDFLRTGRTHWLTSKTEEQYALQTFTPEQVRRMFALAGLEVFQVLGKTVLPLRGRREQLEDPDIRRRWLAIERRLADEPANLGRCAHLQVAARKALKSP